MSNSDAKRDLSLDILRIIATFAVILLHVAAQKDYFETTYPTNEWIPRLFYNSFVRWCVPIFVMISGALFLNPLKNITIRRLFSKNVLRIVCAYIVWTVAYALYTILQDDKDISLLPLFSIEGYGSFHLWFLKMILGLYVAVPILRYVTKAKSIEIYFICVSLIGTFLIPFLLEVLSHYNAIISNNLKDIISTMRLDIASGYTGYFVLGHYLYSYGIKRKAYRMIVYVSGWASVLSVIIFTYCFSHHNGAVYDFLLGYLCPFTLIESIALFVLLTSMDYEGDVKFSGRLINYTSKISFGIYLVHVFMLYILKDIIGIDSASFSPWSSIPILSLVVFILSYIVASVLYRIPLCNKYLT